MQYLMCIQYISQTLLKDARMTSFEMAPNTKKCIHMGQQCMERVLKLHDYFESKLFMWQNV